MNDKQTKEIEKLKAELLKVREQRDYFSSELQKCINEKIELAKQIVK